MLQEQFVYLECNIAKANYESKLPRKEINITFIIKFKIPLE